MIANLFFIFRMKEKNKGGKEEIKKKGKIRTEIERKTKKETGERKMM